MRDGAHPIEARLFEPLLDDDEDSGKEFIDRLNPNSLTVMHGFAENAAKDAAVGDTFQFLRMGYFCKDKDSTDEKSVYNRVVPLRDSYRP